MDDPLTDMKQLSKKSKKEDKKFRLDKYQDSEGGGADGGSQL